VQKNPEQILLIAIQRSVILRKQGIQQM